MQNGLSRLMFISLRVSLREAIHIILQYALSKLNILETEKYLLSIKYKWLY
jgi:hypothetical protein